MGPGVAGLGALRAAPPLPRWQERLERTWGVTLRPTPTRVDATVAVCVAEWESGLARIDFAEVTDEDRATFLEHVVSAQVRRALGAGRFDLALALAALGSRRVAELLASGASSRPRPTYGVVLPFTASPASPTRPGARS